MSFLDKLKNAVSSTRAELTNQVSRFKNKKFMEGTIAVCACISMSSNGASSEEKQKMVQFIQNSPELKVFKTEEVITFFNQLAGNFEFDIEIGKGEAFKYLMALKDQPEAAQLALRVGLAVAKSDGDFDAQEQAMAKEICVALNLDPSAFQL